jgi:hypothetical protein
MTTDQYLAGRGCEAACDATQQGGLAGAVRPSHSESLARLQSEIQPSEDFVAPEFPREPLNPEQAVSPG